MKTDKKTKIPRRYEDAHRVSKKSTDEDVEASIKMKYNKHNNLIKKTYIYKYYNKIDITAISGPPLKSFDQFQFSLL